MQDRASLSGLLGLFVSTTTLSLILLLVERLRMQAYSVPETVSLAGFNALVSAFSNLDTLIIALLVVFAVAIVIFAVIIACTVLALLVIGTASIVAAATTTGLFLLAIQAQVFGVKTKFETVRLLNRVAKSQRFPEDAEGFAARTRYLADQTETHTQAIKRRISWVRGVSFNAVSVVLGAAQWTLKVIFFQASVPEGERAGPQTSDRRLAWARLLTLSSMLLLAFMTVSSLHFFRDRALRGATLDTMSDVHLFATPGLKVIEAMTRCHPLLDPSLCEWVLSTLPRFPVVHLSLSRSIGPDVSQLDIAATSEESAGSFRTDGYFYLGDFGDYAFLADEQDRDRRILVRNSAIIELSTSPVRAREEELVPLPQDPEVTPEPTVVVVTQPAPNVTVDAAPDLELVRKAVAEAISDLDDGQVELATQLAEIAADLAELKLPSADLNNRYVDASTVFFVPYLAPQGLALDLDISLGSGLEERSGMVIPRQPSQAFVNACMELGSDVLGKIVFEENSADLDAPASQLSNVLAMLQQREPTDAPLTLLLAGRSSATGHPLANLVMSERRAEVVAGALLEALMGPSSGDPIVDAKKLRNRHAVTLLATGLGEHPDTHETEPRIVEIMDCSLVAVPSTDSTNPKLTPEGLVTDAAGTSAD